MSNVRDAAGSSFRSTGLPSTFQRLLSVFVMLLVFAILCNRSSAATYTVTTLADSGTGSLRTAIGMSNETSGSTIKFSVTGVIKLASSLPPIYTSVTIAGTGYLQITIDGSSSYRAFVIDAPSDTVTLSGLRVQNCSDGSEGQGGAAINLTTGNLYVTNCEFLNDIASGNGGVLATNPIDPANVTLTDCSIFNCLSDSLGAALYFQPAAGGTLRAIGTSIDDNYGGQGNAAFIGPSDTAGFNSCSISYNDGGAIYNNGTLTLTNCVAGDNTNEESGGVVAQNSGSTTITGCTFGDNQSLYSGGALYNDGGTMTVSTSVFTGNYSGTGTGTGFESDGGAIDNEDTTTVTGCTFTGNEAGASGVSASGGAIGGSNMNSTGTLVVRNCTITSSTASTDGGGIYSAAPLTVYDCTLTSNSSDLNGGGIDNDSTGTISDSTLYANTASGVGGGLYNDTAGMSTLYDCTFSSNSAVGSGAGIENSSTSSTAVTAEGCILYDENENEVYSNVGTVSVNYCDVDGGYPGNNINANPLLSVLGSYGGLTQTMGLLPGSPCLGAGEGLPVGLDQRGVDRPQNGRFDIGAFESQGFTIQVLSGSGQTTSSGSAFPNSLVADVLPVDPTDPVVGGIVTFAAPMSGASATFATPNATIASFDSASTTATANGTVGTYSVVATTAGAPGSAVFTLTNAGIPVITSFSPTSGTSGTTVTVTGRNFTGTTAVSLDGYPATFQFISDTSLTFVVPSGASTGAIHVKNSAGLGASTTNFTVAAATTITSFSPANGAVGSTVTITGTGFTGASAVSLDGYPASYTVVNATTITFIVPSGAATGVIHVKVGSTVAASSTNFVVVGVPVITSFTPTSGPVGTVIAVTGSSFTGITAASVDGYPATYVFNSDSSVSVTVPKGASTGAIHIKNTQGLGASSTNFTVTM
jgi:hypothetical protein